MGCTGKYNILAAFLMMLALQVAFCTVRGKAQAKPCQAALQRAKSRIAQGISDVRLPTCDANGYYKTGYYCGAFFCFCVVDKYGKKDYKISLANCTKPQSTNPAPPSCVNKNNQCDAWAYNGYCHNSSKYRAYMVKNCKKACCVNNNTSCSSWASTGECVKNPLYMFKYCKAACYGCTC